MQNKYLLPTASKPLIYLRFLKSYNYTRTKKKRYTNVCLFFLCAALLLANMTAPRRNILFDLSGFALSFSAWMCYNKSI